MATGTTGGGFLSGLGTGLAHGGTDIVVPSEHVRAAASQAASQTATQIEAQAGGYASSALAGVHDVFSGAIDELHTQEEQAATWLRWGTVAFALLVLLVAIVVGAWFFAPARALVGAAT